MLSESDIQLIVNRYTINLESLANLAKEVHMNYFKLRNLLIARGIKIRNRTESLQKYVKYSTCVICGRRFRMRKSWDDTTNHHKQTCGDPSCLHELRSQVQKECWEDNDDRKKHQSDLFTGRSTEGWKISRGDQRPNWAGGHTSYYYRHLAFDVYGIEKKCSFPGCDSRSCLCVHHKDGNRDNNTRENLDVRCKSHHTGNHAKENALWKKHISKKY